MMDFIIQNLEAILISFCAASILYLVLIPVLLTTHECFHILSIHFVSCFTTDFKGPVKCSIYYKGLLKGLAASNYMKYLSEHPGKHPVCVRIIAIAGVLGNIILCASAITFTAMQIAPDCIWRFGKILPLFLAASAEFISFIKSRNRKSGDLSYLFHPGTYQFNLDDYVAIGYKPSWLYHNYPSKCGEDTNL